MKRFASRSTHTTRGFTLVELISVIVGLAILATIGFYGYSSVLDSTRDTDRSNKANLISESLEKYFDKNGEYPNCETLAADPTLTLSASDSNIFQTPTGDESTPSIVCMTNPSYISGDYYFYEGSPASCQTDGVEGCTSYKLTYIQEEGQTVASIDSRRETPTSDSAPDITMAATKNESTKVATGTSTYPNCSNGNAPEIQTRYDTNGDGWTNWAASTNGTVTISGGVGGWEYAFQSRARCGSSWLISDWSESNVDSVSFDVSGDAPTVTVVISGSNAVATASGGTCSSGSTMEREIRSASTNTATLGTYSSWGITNSKSVSANQGYKYSFQVQGYCKVTATGERVGPLPGNTASVIRPISAPAAVTASVSTSGNTTTFNRTNASCPTGTTASYQRQAFRESYTGSWTAVTSTWTWDTSSQGWNYRGQYQAKCSTALASSPWSATSNAASYVRAVSQPTFGSWAIKKYDSHEIDLGSKLTCGSGATRYARADIYTYDYPYSTGAKGWWVNNTSSSGGKWVTNWMNVGSETGKVVGFSSGYTITAGARASGTLTVGSRYKAKAEAKCYNSTTNRESSVKASGESSIFKVP